jgi:hypothetical protein
MNKTRGSGHRSGLTIGDLSALETRPALSRSRRHPHHNDKTLARSSRRLPHLADGRGGHRAASALPISPSPVRTGSARMEPSKEPTPRAAARSATSTSPRRCPPLPFERTMRPSVLAPGHGFFLRSDLRPAAPVSTQSGRAVVQIMFFWNFFVPRMVDGTVGFDLAFGFTDSKSWPQRAASISNNSTPLIAAC